MERKEKLVLCILMFFILDAWLLGALSAALINKNLVNFYLTGPVKVSLMFALGISGGEVIHPEIFKAWKMLNLGIIFLAFTLLLYKYVPGKDERDSTLLGSAKWLTLSEAQKVFKTELSPGILFGTVKGKPVVLPPDARGNRNVIVLGPPGTGKSRAYVRNNLFQAVASGWSVVVTDPKGELTRDFKSYLEEKNYIVKVFNLVDMAHSDRWNPLSEVRTDIDAQTFCEVVIANTAAAAGKKGGDPFWDRAETNLLKALVLYVVNELPKEEQNLGEMYKILASSDPKHMHNIFSTLPYDHPAKMPFNIYAETSDRVRSGVIIGLGTRLQVFQNQMVRNLTETSDINLSMPGGAKCAFFCIVSDMDHTFDFLASLYFSFLFISLTRTADHSGGELDIPVNFLLDEFCNIGHIPDFTKKISTMRGRGIACSVIFQSLGQLENHYPDKGWETIMADCDSWLVLGVKDITSAEYISKHMGTRTIKVDGLRKKLSKPFSLGDRITQLKERRLMNPDELIRLPRDEAILSAFGLNPLKINKMDYTLHPEVDKLIPIQIKEFKPEWSFPPENLENLPEITGEEISPFGEDEPIKYDIPPVEVGISGQKDTDSSEESSEFFC